MKLRPFELALVIFFALSAIVSLVLFSKHTPDPSDEDMRIAAVGAVDIWGTLPAEGINTILADLKRINKVYANVFYTYYHPDDFDGQLVNALADGDGPDLMLVSHEKLVEMRRRIQPVSYDFFPIRDVRDMYLDGAQIFAMSDGLYGYPIAVDPLMMYWNRDMLANNGFLEAPRTWESLVNTVLPSLIKKSSDKTIDRSVVAMGEFINVRNAFGIVSSLLIQGGSDRVVENANGGYTIKLQSVQGSVSDPLASAADFFTRFSKPSNSLYSWNRSFESDRLEFISGDLALYFGYASEGSKLAKTNPNLNFDIAEVPQGASASVRRTYAKFYALSVLSASDNKVGAAAILSIFGGADMSETIAIAYDMVPANRSVVSLGSNDTYGRVAYKSAATALGWLNPNLPKATDILSDMANSINENRSDINQAASDTSDRLRAEY